MGFFSNSRYYFGICLNKYRETEEIIIINFNTITKGAYLANVFNIQLVDFQNKNL